MRLLTALLLALSTSLAARLAGSPDVVRLNSRWLLYYSISEFGKNTSAIALASNAAVGAARRRWGCVG